MTDPSDHRPRLPSGSFAGNVLDTVLNTLFGPVESPQIELTAARQEEVAILANYSGGGDICWIGCTPERDGFVICLASDQPPIAVPVPADDKEVVAWVHAHIMPFIAKFDDALRRLHTTWRVELLESVKCRAENRISLNADSRFQEEALADLLSQFQRILREFIQRFNGQPEAKHTAQPPAGEAD